MAARIHLRLLPLALAAALSACDDHPSLDPRQQIGADPALPPPANFLMPPMQVPEGVGWKAGEHPNVVDGLKIEKIADGLQHPRQLLTLPNGDVLVVES